MPIVAPGCGALAEKPSAKRGNTTQSFMPSASCSMSFLSGAGRTWFEGPLARCGAVRRGLSVDQAEATLSACLRSLGKAYQLFQRLGIQV